MLPYDPANPPLRVRYPGVGRRWIFHWKNMDGCGRLLVATSERQLDQMADVLAATVPTLGNRVCRRSNDTVQELLAAMVIDLVAPSDRHQRVAAGDRRERSVMQLMNDVRGRFRDTCASPYVLPPDVPLPPPFQWCPKYEWEGSQYEDHEEPEDDSYRQDFHPGCRHCQERVQLVGMTLEELFARYYTRYAEVFGEVIETPKGVVCPAPPVADDVAIGYASASEVDDHTSSGLWLADMPDDPESIGNAYDALFFYKVVETLDLAPYEAKLATAKARVDRTDKDEDDDRDRRWRAEREAKQAVQRGLLFSVFDVRSNT
jgi:hypothetical protein